MRVRCIGLPCGPLSATTAAVDPRMALIHSVQTAVSPALRPRLSNAAAATTAAWPPPPPLLRACRRASSAVPAGFHPAVPLTAAAAPSHVCRRAVACATSRSGSGGASDDASEDDEGAAAGAAAEEDTSRPLRVERLLANLGYGKRQECAALIKRGRVTYAATGAPAKVRSARDMAFLPFLGAGVERVLTKPAAGSAGNLAPLPAGCALLGCSHAVPFLPGRHGRTPRPEHPHENTPSPAPPALPQIGEKARSTDVLLDQEVLDPPSPLTVLLHKVRPQLVSPLPTPARRGPWPLLACGLGTHSSRARLALP
jgi:hypothetical protein